MVVFSLAVSMERPTFIYASSAKRRDRRWSRRRALWRRLLPVRRRAVYARTRSAGSAR